MPPKSIRKNTGTYWYAKLDTVITSMIWTDLQYDVIARTAQNLRQDESDFRHQTLCHQWRTGHPHHTFHERMPALAYGAIIPKAFVTEKTNSYTARNAFGCGTLSESMSQRGTDTDSRGYYHRQTKCVCGRCEECPAMAIEISGTEYTAEYLMHEIEKEIPFMDQSGGGVTFCGGEPLLIPNFLDWYAETLDGQQGIHRAVDTTFAHKETVDEVMRNCELLLIDLKSMDSTVHQTFCDVPNELILENIRRSQKPDFPYYIRIPLIEGECRWKNIKLSAEFLSASLPRHPEIINLLPYHDIGKESMQKLGSIYNPKDIKCKRHPRKYNSSAYKSWLITV